MNFSAILEPRTELEFLQRILGVTALHIPGDEGKFSHLLPWNMLNRSISSAAGHLQMYKGEDLLPTDSFCSKDSDGVARLRVGDVNALLRAGAILAINAVEELCEPIACLFEDIEQKLEVPARAHARVSLGVDADLKPKLHWHDHDVIVLQVAGTKCWEVFGSTDKFPTAVDQPRLPTWDAKWSKTLTAGDLLYLPRGWWHVEQNTNEASIDLCLGFRSPTGLDFAGRILDQLHEVEFMRMDYPRFLDARARAEYLTALQGEIVRACNEPGLVRDFLRDLWRLAPPRTVMSLPWGANQFPSDFPAENVIVPLPRFRRPEIVLDVGDSAELVQNGETLLLPGTSGKIVSRIFGSTCVKVADLLQEGAGDPSLREGILSLLSTLVERGFVALRDPQAEADFNARMSRVSASEARIVPTQDIPIESGCPLPVD